MQLIDQDFLQRTVNRDEWSMESPQFKQLVTSLKKDKNAFLPPDQFNPTGIAQHYLITHGLDDGQQGQPNDTDLTSNIYMKNQEPDNVIIVGSYDMLGDGETCTLF